MLAAVRDQLRRRAEALGWRESREVSFHLLVDGVEHQPVRTGEGAMFRFSPGAKTVRLLSDVWTPVDLWGGSHDTRRLGLCVSGIMLSGGIHAQRDIALDDPRLAGTFHSGEEEAGVAWRWTDGDAVLHPGLWAGLEGPVSMHLSFSGHDIRQWTLDQSLARPGFSRQAAELCAVA